MVRDYTVRIGLSKRMRDLIEPLISFLLPIFFVLIGWRVDLRAFANPQLLMFAGALTVAAIVGKLVSGLRVVEHGVDRAAVGVGMTPRGEAGLIFASVGTTLMLQNKPIISPAVFSAAVIMHSKLAGGHPLHRKPR